MAPKIVPTTGSSYALTYVSDDFASQDQEINFIKHFTDYHLISFHYVDVNYFMKFELFNSFDNNKLGEVFPKLVKLLYTYLRYKDGVITIEICKTQISISFEEFSIVCDFPCIDSLYTSKAPSCSRF